VAGLLAAQGAHVVLTAPDEAAVAHAVQEVKCVAPAGTGGAVSGLVLDQATKAGVTAFCDRLQAGIAAHGWRIRGVICNAATLAASKEPSWALHPCLAVNHLGTWRLLTQLHVRGFLGSSSRCHIVVVSSFTHRCERARDLLAWLSDCVADAGSGRRRHPASAHAYALSKAGVSCVAAAFAETNCHFKGSSAHAGQHLTLALADPGLVDTQLTRQWPPVLRAVMRSLGIALRLMRPPQQGALAVMAALADDEVCDSRLRGTHALYVFGAHGVELRPGAAGGGDAQVSRTVDALTRKLDAVYA